MKRLVCVLILMVSVVLVFAITQEQIQTGKKMLGFIQTMSQNHHMERSNNPSEGLLEDYSEGEWVESGNMKFWYDNQNMMTQVITYNQVIPDSFVAIMKYDLAYNSNNQLTEFILSMNSNPLGTPIWIEFLKSENVFSPDNHLIHTYNYECDENFILFCSGRNHFTYNNGIMETMYQWSLDEDTNEIEYMKSEFSYENGRINTMTNYTSTDSLDWLLSDKETWAYDATDTSTYNDIQYMLDHGIMGFQVIGNEFTGIRITSRTQETWLDDAWMNESRDVYSYSPQWDMVSVYSENYYDNAWSFEEKTDYTYDENHNVTTQTESNWFDSDWMPSQRYTYTYETSNNDVSVNHNMISIKSYPNPFFNNASIQIKSAINSKIEVSLYDIKGRKVSSSKCLASEGDNNYNLNHLFKGVEKLSSGIYFLKVSNNHETYCKKIIKIK